MFDVLAHADWSIAAKKRWVSIARRLDAHWQVEAPKAVGNCEAFVSEVVAPTSPSLQRLTGFDFPIGVPANYGRRTDFEGFRELLVAVDFGDWDDFFNVAVSPDQISLRRPFYPQRSTKGAALFQLLHALEVSSLNELLRVCERQTDVRNAACSMFWTLGAKQVGKAAISGWREIVRPALNMGSLLWPFDGRLDDLSEQGGSIICETYPAEAYGHIGIRFASGQSKRRQADRASKAQAILTWAVTNEVILSEATCAALLTGFGPSNAGEDPFDSLVGLLSMIEVVDGRRSEGPINDSTIQRWEGWILGQSS